MKLENIITSIVQLQGVAVIGPRGEAIDARLPVKGPVGEVDVADGGHRDAWHPEHLSAGPEN